MEQPRRPREIELLTGLRAVECISGTASVQSRRADAARERGFLSMALSFAESGGRPWLTAFFGGLAGFNLVCRLSIPDRPCQVLLVSATANNRRQLRKVESALPDVSLQWMELGTKRNVASVLYALCEVVTHPGTSFRVLRLLSRLMARKHPMHAIDLARYVVANVMVRRALRRIGPKVVAVSNDHTPACVAIAAAARGQGRSTAYLQHAHVSPLFPPLNFDLNVLDSQAALDIYEARGSRRGCVIFKGVDGDSVPLRLKLLAEPKARLKILVMLTNAPPRSALFEGLARLVSDERIANVAVRPHPAAQSSWYDDLPDGVRLHMAHSSLADEARKADLVLAGNTSAVLEVLKTGTPTVLWESIDDIANDYYGFVAHRVVPRTADPASLSFVEIVAFFSDDWPERMRYFDASYMDGEVADLRSAMLDLMRLWNHEVKGKE